MMWCYVLCGCLLTFFLTILIFFVKLLCCFQPISYSWSHNEAIISGATENILTVIDVVHADAGNYSCVPSNSAGSGASSSQGYLHVWTKPAIILDPQNFTEDPDLSRSVTFSCDATGDPAPEYSVSLFPLFLAVYCFDLYYYFSHMFLFLFSLFLAIIL